jgi:hypothetical protein
MSKAVRLQKLVPTGSSIYERTPWSSRGMPRRSAPWLIWLAMALLFFLTASNGRPVRFSSGFFAIAIAPILIAGLGPRCMQIAFSKGRLPVSFALILFAIANLASAAASINVETVEATLFRGILPFIVYLSFVGLAIERRDETRMLLAFAAGGGWLFLQGTVAYLSEWGIPDLKMVLWSRFDVDRMEGYSEATLGNVGHMGSYCILVCVPILYGTIRYTDKILFRLFFIAVVSLGLFNLVVSGSRAGLLLILAAIFLIIASLGIGRLLTLAAIVLGIAFFTMPSWITFVSDPEVLSRYMPGLVEGGVDISVEERLESVHQGWEMFWENYLIGIGPGMSLKYNTWGVPHMSLPHQFSELGLIGGICFVYLNVVVIFNALIAVLTAKGKEASSHRFLWMLGPALWYSFGLFAGITFNLAYALVWSGISAAMLGLAGAARVDIAPSIKLPSDSLRFAR